jgi:hypothetical protein
MRFRLLHARVKLPYVCAFMTASADGACITETIYFLSKVVASIILNLPFVRNIIDGIIKFRHEKQLYYLRAKELQMVNTKLRKSR